MKMNLKIASLFVVSTLLAACNVDTLPEGGTVTDQQKQEVIEMMPERIAADVANLASTMFSQFSVGGTNYYWIDFGYPSVCIAYDYNGPDMVCVDNNYNWYNPACSYTDRDPNYIVPYIEWTFYYNYLKAANDILSAIAPDTENQTLKYYRGQALGARAFTLFGLVQRFQFTYKGHEDEPSIPMVLDDMTAEQAGNNPRASVSAVYARIIEDLNNAIALLEGFNRPNASTIDQRVAYGLRARVYLVMNEWQQAAADAAKAMSGYTPYTRDEVSKPSFQSVSHAWIWGCEIDENDLVAGGERATWQSWLCSLNGGLFTTKLGTYARCNVEFYQKIPATDVRKGWWVDENLKSPLIDNLRWQGYPNTPIGSLEISQVKQKFEPYTNVKFGPTDDVIGTTKSAGDWPLMRAEEMLLIQAEATGMSGDLNGGKQLLESFVKTYRDPSYTCKASTPQEFQNAVWLQRRIELWGEGFAPMDLMRLKKPLVRFHSGRTSNFPDLFKFNIPAEDPSFLCTIPNGEINANEGISPDQNNISTVPKPGQGAGLLDGITD
ncbi:RagB/SusD family nutrient uptake outer membrane protein [Alistipes sp.]|uniref:RagB/SusD family nutrient uptake outer membrane protein n=1 Tax=Alistipes sp. TaxID=1872444 RepID=UPI003AF05E2E